MKLSNNNNSDAGFSYGAVMNSQRYIICSGITQPRQFSLGNKITMSGITDKLFQQRKQHCKSTARNSHD
jgi:hypothetical protein